MSKNNFNPEEIIDSINFEEFKTGENEITGLCIVPTKKGFLEFVRYKKGYYKPHIHNQVSSKLFFLRGKGIAVINGKEAHYKLGSVFEVPKGTSHGFRVIEDTIFISVQSKPIINRKTGTHDYRFE